LALTGSNFRHNASPDTGVRDDATDGPNRRRTRRSQLMAAAKKTAKKKTAKKSAKKKSKK
jgi:hypothetical protein